MDSSAGFHWFFNPLNQFSLSRFLVLEKHRPGMHSALHFCIQRIQVLEIFGLMVGNRIHQCLRTQPYTWSKFWPGYRWINLCMRVDRMNTTKVWSAQYQIQQNQIYFFCNAGNTWTQINASISLTTNNLKIECLNNSNDGIFLDLQVPSVYYLDSSTEQLATILSQGLPATIVMAIKAMQSSGIVRVYTPEEEFGKAHCSDPFQPWKVISLG